MEPNVDRGMWSVVVLLAAIVIGGVVLIAFPKISGKIANSMEDTVSKGFSGEMPAWVNEDSEAKEPNDDVNFENIESQYENFLKTKEALQFEGVSSRADHWQPYQGSKVSLEQGVEVSEWNTKEATRITTTGGTHVTKYYINTILSPKGDCSIMPRDKMYYTSIYVKNEGSVKFRIAGIGKDQAYINPGETVRLQKVHILSPTSCTQLGFSLHPNEPVDSEIKVVVYKPVAFYADPSETMLKEVVKRTVY